MKFKRLVESDFERRRRERAARSGGDISDVERTLAQLRRERGSQSELRGKVDPKTVERVRGFQRSIDPAEDPYAFHLDRDLRHQRSAERAYGEEMADLALGAEHFPLDNLYDFQEDPRCTECGSDRVVESLAATGAPVDIPEFDLGPALGGVLVTCYACGHQMFFKPYDWPVKGRRDERGEWVWAEGFVPLVGDEALLFETGMNRRNFLKFLGKAGAAAYRAPLGELGPKGLEKLSWQNNRIGQAYGSGEDIKALEDAGLISKNRAQTAKKIRDQHHYEFDRKIRRRRDRSFSPEVGYERQGIMDPRSARIAEPVGPFEDLLKDALDKLI